MRSSEWIALAYFAYLLAAALAVRTRAAHRWRAATEAVLAALCVILVAWSGARGSMAPLTHVRDWAPLVYLLWCYWIPAHVRDGLDVEAERRLRHVDVQWAGPLIRGVSRLPRLFVEVLEFTYLLCYPLLPLGFALVRYPGAQGGAEAYQAAVLVAASLSYGALPWVRTRPPRAVEAPPVPHSAVRALNERLLLGASVQLNTFPSGHVATSVAAALCLLAARPIAGALFVLAALGIAVTCVSRRYHYLADVVLGAAAGGVGFMVSRWVT